MARENSFTFFGELETPPVVLFNEETKNILNNVEEKMKEQPVSSNHPDPKKVKCAHTKWPQTKYNWLDTPSELIFKKHDDIQKEGVYEKGFATISKRIERLYQKLDEAKRGLGICGTDFAYNEAAMYEVKQTFETLYPDKEFVFYAVMLRSKEETSKQDGNMHFIYSKRSVNAYDFAKTNFEWAFLDNVRLNEKKKWISFEKKQKKDFTLVLFEFMPTLVNMKINIVGFKLEIGIGKKAK